MGKEGKVIYFVYQNRAKETKKKTSEKCKQRHNERNPKFNAKENAIIDQQNIGREREREIDTVGQGRQ